MAISDSYLKSCLGREREKVEEKADRDGLWVRISKKGAVTFFYRYRFLGKQDKMTIGSYPEFGLKAARDEVVKWSAILARGENPRIRQSLDKAKINSQYTFEELFREWYSMVCIQKETADQILRSFELHVFPKLGRYPAHQLTHWNCATVVWYCVVAFHFTLIALSPASGTFSPDNNALVVDEINGATLSFVCKARERINFVWGQKKSTRWGAFVNAESCKLLFGAVYDVEYITFKKLNILQDAFCVKDKAQLFGFR